MFFGSSRHKVKPPAPASAPDGFFLGAYLAGAVMADVALSRFYWLRQKWTRHALVLGAPGSGKSETVLRMAYEFAGKVFNGLSVQVLYFDAKNDPDLPGRFGALMTARGRRTSYFPEQRIDLWQGDWRAIRRRLMRIVPYGTKDGSSFYRDIARVAMEYVCSAWPQPPDSSAELFSRLGEAAVQDRLRAHPLLTALEPEMVDQVLLRYQAFWAAPGLLFDGDLRFADIDTGFFRIDPDIFGDEADYALCMLFLAFVHYCKADKPQERLVVLVLDEFSAIANAFEMDRLAEELRSFNVCLIFVPQSLEGMGSENQRWRLFKAARLKIVHRYEDPLPLVEVAGRKRVPEFSLSLFDESGQGDRVSWAERWKVPPEWILSLGDGEAVAIREGEGTKVEVEMAPAVHPVELPEPAAIDRVYRWRRPVTAAGDVGGEPEQVRGSVDPAAIVFDRASFEDSPAPPGGSEPDEGEKCSGEPPSYAAGEEG